MTSEGLEEVFKSDSADTCAGKFPLVSMGGRAVKRAQTVSDLSERGLEVSPLLSSARKI
jgi:hypothetical protein